MKDAKCKSSKTSTKYQLDSRGDFCYVWIWVLNVLTVCKRDALFRVDLFVPKLKPMLKLTSLNTWQCHKSTKSFSTAIFSSLLFFRQQTSELGPMLYEYYLLLVVNVNIIFLVLIDSCMAKSPCSKFETCYELAANLSPWWNVTEDVFAQLKIGINLCF